MPPNKRKGKVASNAVGRLLLKEKGGENLGSSKQRMKKAASEFHELPHMFQEAPAISEFMTGGNSRTQQIKSIIERNALDEFLDTSLASQAAFLKQNAVRLLVKQADNQTKDNHQSSASESGIFEATRVVPIPRRPINYVSGRPEIVLSTKELGELESEAFLKWRLTLSEIEEQEGRVMTPFERNLEFWRQLWRVLERSDVVVQILDARNPLFFRSLDLELYVKEINPSKETILLLNKADLVEEHVRAAWAGYFEREGLVVMFFSALDELRKQGVATDEKVEDEENEDSSFESDELELSDVNDGKPDRLGRSVNKEHASFNIDDTTPNRTIPEAAIAGASVNKCDGSYISSALSENRSSFLKPKDDSFVSVCNHQLKSIRQRKEDVLNATQLLDALQEIKKILQERRQDDVAATIRIPPYDAEEEEKKEEEEEEADKQPQEFDSSEEAAVTREEAGAVQLKQQQKRTFKMEQRDDVDFVVGYVGYPNVGKSSVINSLLCHKAVSVSRQPGKTKHFQTIRLSAVRLTLCDCPGLVFPQIVRSKPYLITNGVSPIDHVRGDFLSPIQIVCNSIPLRLLRKYKLDPGQVYSTTDIRQATTESEIVTGRRMMAGKFLTQLALSRGFVAGGKGGLVDLFQSAKLVLRDFTTGKLLHWTLPPGEPAETLSRVCASTGSNKVNNNLAAQATEKKIETETNEGDLLLVQMVNDNRGKASNDSIPAAAPTLKMTKRKIRIDNKEARRVRCLGIATT